MAFTFPSSPATNDTYSVGSRTYTWTGTKWVLSGGVITATQLAANSVTTAKILDANVTAAKLANTAVTPGSYTAADITVDAQGRLTSATSGTSIASLDDVPGVIITETYAIGDTGPAGGKIFITPSTAGNSTGKYFEAAPSASEVIRTWATGANQSLAVSGADGTAIGTGAQNTIDIVNQAGNVAATSAAAYASDYAVNGYSDWFLPSKNELNELYTNRNSVGGFSSVPYWSSSEYSANDAWYQNFTNGTQSNIGKSTYGQGQVYYVRPVRAFTPSSTPNTGQVLKWNGSAWTNSAAPNVYVTQYTTSGAGTWTCPAGVTQIKLTLIGAGGHAGDVEAITPNSSSSQTFSNTAAGSTTFVVGGTTYTALGGKKGESVSVSGPIFVMSGTGYTQNSSGSSSGSNIGTDFSRYPGCGGAPARASAETYISMTNGTLTFEHTSKANALGYRGQDGVIQVFQVTVVPATTYSFSIGAGGYTDQSYQGSNGAVNIEYVV